jgi:hypothetical protein
LSVDHRDVLFCRAGLAVRNSTKDKSHKKSSNKSKKIMAVPHPDKNWRHKNGVWYYVKEEPHKGDYHNKFLLPAIRKWVQSREKTVRTNAVKKKGKNSQKQ